MHEAIIEKAAVLIAKRSEQNAHNFCTLALIGTDGYPTTSTITISKAGGIRWLTFCTGLGGKSERINHCNKASVCINEDDYHISLVGTIEECTDAETKREMWYAGMGDHFSGYDDPNYCVLRFTTERYNLLVDWESASGTLACVEK